MLKKMDWSDGMECNGIISPSGSLFYIKITSLKAVVL